MFGDYSLLFCLSKNEGIQPLYLLVLLFHIRQIPAKELSFIFYQLKLLPQL